MRAFIVLLLVLAAPAHAQVYRWIDARGTVHYSNTPPPPSVKAQTLDIDARPGPASPDTQDCYSVRCQGERMESRQARRDVLDSQLAAERVALAPPEPRGIEFRKLVTLRRGMTEGEVLAIAGPPDARSRDKWVERFTYLPTRADPFVTTIQLRNGRVAEIEQARQF
jgi:hypothetical protein